MSPQFPPKDPGKKVRGATVHLENWLWDRLQEIAEEVDESRNHVIAKFLEWAERDYENGKEKKGGKSK